MQAISRFGQFLPGVALGIFSVGVIFVGQDYTIGSLTAMGPGFLPVALGLLLLVLSAILLFSEWQTLQESSLPAIPLLPLLLASSSILVWTLLVDIAGFIPAALIQLMLASLASPHQRWRGVAFSILLVTLLSYGLFVGLLGLPVSAFGG